MQNTRRRETDLRGLREQHEKMMRELVIAINIIFMESKLEGVGLIPAVYCYN